MAHSGSSGHWKPGFNHLDTDACYDSLPVTFDSGVGLDSCPSFQSSNILSIHRDQNSDQLISALDRLHLSSNQDAFSSVRQQQQQHNLSLVQAAPVTTPESCEFFQKNEEGDTMLHIAIIQPNLDLAEKYINVADDPELISIQNFHYCHTPLHLAVITNQPDIVRLLVVRGAALWKQDHEGNTPLHLACKLGLLDCLRQLTAPLSEQELYSQRIRTAGMMRHTYMTDAVEQTASIKNYEGETCLHVAQNSSSSHRLNIIMFLLLSLSLDVNMQEGKCGYTILHQAIKCQDIDLIKALVIQPGIDVNKACYNRRTALSLARCQHLDQVVDLLLARGALDNSMDDNYSCSDSDDDQIDGFDDLII